MINPANRLVLAAVCVALASFPAATVGQEQAALEAGLRVAQLRAEPVSLTIQLGQTALLRVTALDANGRVVEAAQLRVSGPRRGDGAVAIAGDTVRAVEAGTSEIVATVVLPPDAGREPPRLAIPVTVTWPPVERVVIHEPAARLYAGTTLRHHADALHADGSTRPNAQISWETTNPGIATVDRFGAVTAHAPGAVAVTARFEGAVATTRHQVVELPAARLELDVSADQVRTGDVVSLDARALDGSGRALRDVPIDYTFRFVPDDTIKAPGAAGLIRDARFVGEVPGRYTVMATAGPLVARRPIDVRPRQVVRTTEIVGHGSVTHVHTSDLWVFEGRDGRDYALTGTWGADGWAYVWDVTDPSNIVKTDSIHLDARTVNDVKVSPNARYAALSREGASNRRNGVVILDLSNPAHPTIAANYDDGLTGGVHNMFATDDHLFALSGGEKYVILDMRDIRNPRYVAEFDFPASEGGRSRIHDVWVHDGIAYSSDWENGVVVVDVGNGRWGGTIENPKLVTNVPYPVGRTHAAFPYFQPSTGKVYLILGDEIIGRTGLAWAGMPNSGRQGGVPEVTTGYYHIIDFTDPENPQDVARYEVKEFGTHNLWVEDDMLFSAYYEGGVRVVDVSGELMGNLAEQGREIAVFKAYDPNGFVANGTMVWGAQPHKGHVFLADHYNGLWAVRLQPAQRAAS